MRTFATALFASIVVLSACPASANTLTIMTVHDGGTVEFEGGFVAHIKGVTVPDTDTPIGRLAHDFLKRRLEGQVVAVFTWTTDDTAAGIVYGPDGLPFAKIMCGRDLATDIAAELLEHGLARIDPEHLPRDCAHYREIERQARWMKVGVWATSP